MEYNFRAIEKKWQQYWKDHKIYKISNKSAKPKYYVLDMFPYPSGTGLHVGHPLGYIASDIYARYKRLKGYNVLHPMGYDAFGLPAEQYALDTGQHPAITTEKNIETFRKQLDNIGFCYDWDRVIKTSDSTYYKWTQWIFLQLFNSWYNTKTNKAEKINTLINIFEKEGNSNYPIQHSTFNIQNNSPSSFTAAAWKQFDEQTQQSVLMEYRLAYCGYGEVNWCEALGTVLANDEVVNGVSERGGHPVVKKTLRQWYLRITAYADRLLQGLTNLDFSDAMKDMQSNWIGKSSGAQIEFKIQNSKFKIDVYTTRPDTIFGADFLVLAPEHEIITQITTPEQKEAIEKYITHVKSRSERERMAEKKISGCFTGAYAIHPFTQKQIPIWIAEYVLAGYGTGAIMAVPCADERDHKFAKHFDIPITNIIGDAYNGEEANTTKKIHLINSLFLNGLTMQQASEIIIQKLEELGIGERKINYKFRDAAFSRQRYWGEPFPIIWENGIAYPLNENELPLELPHVDNYTPGPEGQGPLANIPEWTAKHLETNTMPGYAGSSWYFLRYMDPHNMETFCDKKVSDYWNQVDVYVGGTEHAVGHLLYSRMWTKFLYDLGHISFDEPVKKLVNQGMIQGESAFAHAIGFRFGQNMKNQLKDENETKEYKQLQEKYKLMSNIFLSYDSINIIKKTYNDPKTDAEKNHMQLRSEILMPLYKTIIEEISSIGLKDKILILPAYMYYKIYIPISCVNLNNELDTDRLKKEDNRFSNDEFIPLNGKFICSREVEKMSKSKLNVITPDEIIEQYGADTFRMYEMFLGPIEQSKLWDTKGIEGVHRFLKKLWRLFYNEEKQLCTNEQATQEELKILHKTIKKVQEDTERFSYNTAVSAFMICVNELTDLKCHKKQILEPLLIMLTPYAPHIAEELWHALGNTTNIIDATYPILEEKYIIENTKNYPIAINGKSRTEINIALDATQEQIEQIVLSNEIVQKWLEGKTPKKIIYVQRRMVNVVV